jgi:hypothetical protein
MPPRRGREGKGKEEKGIGSMPAHPAGARVNFLNNAVAAAS